MRNYFIFDGRSSLDCGMYISAEPDVYNIPDRNYKTYSVPGGNGDAIFSNNISHSLTQVTYSGVISYEAQPRVRDYLAFLSSRNGFCRLEDTYNPDEYRMAAFVSKPQLQYDPHNKVFSMSLVFIVKPQRWLKIGEHAVKVELEGSKLYNPTYFDAWPIITVKGSGTLKINDSNIVVNENEEEGIIIDTGSQNAYSLSGTNASDKIQQVIYPPLKPGYNDISYDGLKRVEIQPRWETR